MSEMDEKQTTEIWPQILLRCRFGEAEVFLQMDDTFGEDKVDEALVNYWEAVGQMFKEVRYQNSVTNR